MGSIRCLPRPKAQQITSSIHRRSALRSVRQLVIQQWTPVISQRRVSGRRPPGEVRDTASRLDRVLRRKKYLAGKPAHPKALRVRVF